MAKSYISRPDPGHFRKFTTLLFVRGSGMLLAFAISLLIARLFGADMIGRYYLFMSIITGLSVIAKLGLNSTLIKFTAHFSPIQDKEYIRGYWIAAIKISFFVSLVIILMVLGFSEMGWLDKYAHGSKNIVYYACIGLIPFTILGHNVAVLTGLNRQSSASLIDTVTLPLLFLLLIGTVHLLMPEYTEILTLYTCALLTVFLISTLSLKQLLDTKRKLIPTDAKYLVSTSLPVLGINTINFISDWGATYILALYGTLAQVGIYNIGWRIVTVMGIMLLIFNSINAPNYSRDFKEGRLERIDQTSRRTSMIMTSLSLPIIALTIIFADHIMAIFGEEFRGGALVLQILAAGQILNFATGSVGYLLLMTGHEKKLRNLTFIICAAQIIAMLIFIPQYDIYAAAVITMVAIGLKNSISAIVAYKYLGVLTLPIPASKKH